jgi:hypothetical protein
MTAQACAVFVGSCQETTEVIGLAHAALFVLRPGYSNRPVVISRSGACFTAGSHAAVPAAVSLLRPAVCSYLQVAVLARVAAQVQLSS